MRQIAADLGEATGAGRDVRRAFAGSRSAAFDVADAGSPEQVAGRARRAAGTGRPPTRCRTCRVRELTDDEATTSPTAGALEPARRGRPDGRSSMDGELVAVMAPRDGLLRSLVVLAR